MESSIWTGSFLDYTVDFAVNTAKLMYIKCIFALEDALPAPPTRAAVAFSAISTMADPRATRLGAVVRIATRVKTPMKVAMAMKLMKDE